MPADSRDFSKDGVVRGRVAFAALLACVPLLLGAHRGTWRKTAESHLRFAREQRCVLSALIKRKSPAGCPGYVEPVHQPTETEQAREIQALRAKALLPDNVKRLRSRIEAFFGADTRLSV